MLHKKKIDNIAKQFVNGIPIYYIWDKDNILDDKESPSDNPEKWKKLIKNNIYKIK